MLLYITRGDGAMDLVNGGQFQYYFFLISNLGAGVGKISTSSIFFHN